jgi:outer membrane lipoprotein SlyB
MQIRSYLEQVGIDDESLIALALALGSVAGGLLGAWVGGGAGLIIFLVVFVPVVVLALRNAGISERGSRRRRR